MASDIAWYYPDKEVTIVSRSAKLANKFMEEVRIFLFGIVAVFFSLQPRLRCSQAFSDMVQKHVAKLKIRVVLGEEVKLDDTLFKAYKNEQRVHYLVGENTVTTNKCKAVLLFPRCIFGPLVG